MKKDFRIVTIKPEYNSALAVIIRKSLEEHNANKPGTVYFDPTTDNLSSLFSTKGSQYFVLLSGNKVAGGAGYFPTEGLPEDTCELVKMYLSADFRNQGLGKLMLNHTIQMARADGYKQMYIETLPELTTAIPLYEKTGFHFLDGPLGNSGHFGCTVWMLMQL